MSVLFCVFSSSYFHNMVSLFSLSITHFHIIKYESLCFSQYTALISLAISYWAYFFVLIVHHRFSYQSVGLLAHHSRQQSLITFRSATRLLAGSRGNGRVAYESPRCFQGHIHRQRSCGCKSHGNVCKGTAIMACDL